MDVSPNLELQVQSCTHVPPGNFCETIGGPAVQTEVAQVEGPALPTSGHTLAADILNTTPDARMLQELQKHGRAGISYNDFGALGTGTVVLTSVKSAIKQGTVV